MPLDISFDVRTANHRGLLYARLAATAEPAVRQGVVAFVVDVTNNGAKPVTLDELRVDFPSAPAVATHVVPMTLRDANDAPVAVVVPPGETRTWWNQPDGNLFLLAPPAQARVTVSCQGESEVVQTTLPLVAHEAPVHEGYLFPGRRADLAANEYWLGRTGTHGASAVGTQLYAYDLRTVGWNASTQSWSEVLDGRDKSVNENFRIYGKPVVAMAAGVVVACHDGMAENVVGERDLNPGEGNHLYVQHGNELALYAHLQPGSIPEDLLTVGARVDRGQVIGRVGNSGSSFKPHLHLQVLEGTEPGVGPPRPLHFQRFRSQALDNLSDAPDTTGWVDAKDAALPRVKSAIRPPAIAKRRPEVTGAEPDLRDVPVLVGETSPGVANGAGGTVRLPGGKRKPVAPR